jgi:dihydroorotate dehydrogenase
MLYELSRPLLFALDPERAHDLTLSGLDLAARLGLLRPPVSSQHVATRTVMGLAFPNPLGLAAGLDKNGAHVPGLAALGFGFLEVGTVTPRPQPGNPLPRLFRLPDAGALINRMGFNNGGVDALLANLRASGYRGILGINIGKNFDTPIERAADDYLLGFRKVHTLASYVTVNISSPNTQNLRKLQGANELRALLHALAALRDECGRSAGRHIPIAVKIAPDLSEGELDDVADILLAEGMDAVIATNTTLSRAGVEGRRHAGESGGLSGRPLRERSLAVIGQLARRLDGCLPIIGVGGIDNADSARAALDAGASLIQVYSGLIYRGPELIDEICRALA